MLLHCLGKLDRGGRQVNTYHTSLDEAQLRLTFNLCCAPISELQAAPLAKWLYRQRTTVSLRNVVNCNSSKQQATVGPVEVGFLFACVRSGQMNYRAEFRWIVDWRQNMEIHVNVISVLGREVHSKELLLNSMNLCNPRIWYPSNRSRLRLRWTLLLPSNSLLNTFLSIVNWHVTLIENSLCGGRSCESMNRREIVSHNQKFGNVEPKKTTAASDMCNLSWYWRKFYVSQFSRSGCDVI